MGVDLARSILNTTLDVGQQHRLGKEAEHRDKFSLGDVPTSS